MTVIDVSDKVLGLCCEFDPVTDSDAAIVAFHETALQAIIPQTSSFASNCQGMDR